MSALDSLLRELECDEEALKEALHSCQARPRDLFSSSLDVVVRACGRLLRQGVITSAGGGPNRGYVLLDYEDCWWAFELNRLYCEDPFIIYRYVPEDAQLAFTLKEDEPASVALFWIFVVVPHVFRERPDCFRPPFTCELPTILPRHPEERDRDPEGAGWLWGWMPDGSPIPDPERVSTAPGKDAPPHEASGLVVVHPAARRTAGGRRPLDVWVNSWIDAIHALRLILPDEEPAPEPPVRPDPPGRADADVARPGPPAFDAGPWDEKLLDEQQPLVRRLLCYMRHRERAPLEDVVREVWSEEDVTLVSENAVKSALRRANRFLREQPGCKRSLCKQPGEPLLSWE
jgi:hypothetical protein